jgi:hypothetical protein
MTEHAISARSRAVLVCDVDAPVARAVALRLADLGHVVLAASTRPEAVADLPRETARSGIIDVWAGPLTGAPAHAIAAFGRLDSLVMTSETWGFGPTFADAHTRVDLPQRPLVAESLDVMASFLNQSLVSPSFRRRIVFTSTLPTIPFTGVGPAQHRAFEALARALRLELRILGLDVCMVTSDLVAPPPGALSLGARLDRALDALPTDSPYHTLARPLRRAVLALARQAPPVDRVADAVVKATLAPKPRNLAKVRGSGGRLAIPVALRALDKATRKVAGPEAD